MPFIYAVADFPAERPGHYTRNKARKGGRNNATAADALIAAGLAHGVTAAQYPANDNRGESIIMPRMELHAYLGSRRPAHDIGPLVIVRDEKYIETALRDSPAPRRRWRTLNEWHEAKTDFKVPAAADAPMRSILNGKWRCGGRLFSQGGWQGFSADERLAIDINGELVCEVDFKAVHPSMLYIQSGLIAPPDAYSAGAMEQFNRGHCKLAMLCALNTKCIRTAQKAVQNELYKEIGRGVGEYSWRLLDALREAHDPIRHMLFQGVGLNLQFEDSRIAETVISESLRRGFFVFPVHDSFITVASRADELTELMQEAAEICGFGGLRVEQKTAPNEIAFKSE